jgi:hypothetical protein
MKVKGNREYLRFDMPNGTDNYPLKLHHKCGILATPDLLTAIYGVEKGRDQVARSMIEAMGFETAIEFVTAQAERILKENKSNENPIIADVPVRGELIGAAVNLATKRRSR